MADLAASTTVTARQTDGAAVGAAMLEEAGLGYWKKLEKSTRSTAGV